MNTFETKTSEIKTSELAKKCGFTHVAHYTTMQSDKNANLFDLIIKTGAILTPAVSKQSNFDFEEYNNERQVFLGLVNEKNLEPLKNYGSVVMLFDLKLLDIRKDYFINSVFTGSYTQEHSAYPSDSVEQREKIISQIQQNENRNEVVFQNAIYLDASPLVRIVLLGNNVGQRKAMVLKLADYYNNVYGLKSMTMTVEGEFIDIKRNLIK